MSDQPASETPLHIQQAEGLRQLADMIEQNPEIAHTLRAAFSSFGVCVRENARAELAGLYRALKTAGGEPRLDNKIDECRVSGKLAAVNVYAWASAEWMKDNEPKRVVAYEPLVVED
jgi:hypothetical protein